MMVEIDLADSKAENFSQKCSEGCGIEVKNEQTNFTFRNQGSLATEITPIKKCCKVAKLQKLNDVFQETSKTILLNTSSV